MREIAQTKEEFNQMIEDYKDQGWKVVEENNQKAILKQGLHGAWGWHILWFLLAPILGNILYSLYRRRGDRPKKGVIRLEE